MDGLSEEEFEIFQEAALLSTEIELEEWEKQIEEAKETAKNEMGVEFIDVDVELFKEKVANVQEEMLADNESIRELYEHIQTINEKHMAESKNATSSKEGK